jgi:glycosyltransferase involved in cell wall biosynthesis
VIYPFIIRLLAGRKKLIGPTYLEHELPLVSILIPAHNEESIIEKKISSIYLSNYPQERVEVIVGSDASTDRTDEIVLSMRKSHEQLSLVRMNERSGKATVLNCLVDRAK